MVSAMVRLLEIIGNKSSPLAGSVAEALGHVGLRGPLPIPVGDLSSVSVSSSSQASTSAEVANSGTGKEVLSSSEFSQYPGEQTEIIAHTTEPTLSLVLSRLAELITSKEVKVVQKAVLAYGHICFGDSNPEVLQAALTALFSLSRSKVMGLKPLLSTANPCNCAFACIWCGSIRFFVILTCVWVVLSTSRFLTVCSSSAAMQAEDVLFTVGEALSFIWGDIRMTADEILRTSYISLSSSSYFLLGDTIPTAVPSEMHLHDGSAGEARDSAREMILRKLLDELLFSSRKEERCAGSVWLLSLVTYCGRHPKLQKRLPEIQVV